MLKSLISLIFISCMLSGAAQQGAPDRVNSEYDEQNPVISPDGRSLYFTVANHPENTGGTSDTGDIWVSKLASDGRWSVPKNAKALNNDQWNGVLGFSDNGNTIFLMNHYSPAPAGSRGIAKATGTASGWSDPVNITIPYFKNTAKTFGGHVTGGATIAILSLESYGTWGGEDIYVSFSDNGEDWSELKNLGRTINTKYQEFSPYLSSDTKTLYFASNGRGIGTALYKSRRLDDTWVNWSRPMPMEHLNTEGKEWGLRIYDSLQVYTSTVNSDGYGDIKLYIDPTFTQQEGTNAGTGTAADISIAERTPKTENRLITIHGYVSDYSTKKPIDAEITLISPDKELVLIEQSSSEGYDLKIKSVGDYLIRIDAPGYMSLEKSLILETDHLETLEQNYELQSLKVGSTIYLKNVLFEQSKADFLPGSYAELDMVVKLMQDNPKMKIRLEGHTDNNGVAKYNLKLSKERVSAVKSYLVSKEISKSRISGKGYGGSKPIASNNNPESRILNRRVEFTILKNE